MKIHECFSLVYSKKEEVILGKKEESKLPIFGNQNKEMEGSNKQKYILIWKLKKASKITYIENYVYKDCINLCVCTYACVYIFLYKYSQVCMYVYVCL